ncbi:unnamed protein product [Dibothriocephalus latus]|uniref:GON domain-containing protein n=1 Tax=Dibothriocephalus latus TaxID=60516 RepID=A0A3P7LFA6_DIBLA|nr:unnamed protein product [Dibothriocephalus latus]
MYRNIVQCGPLGISLPVMLSCSCVHFFNLMIYCSDMTSSYPREYLPLGKLNYATFIADEKGSPTSKRCHGNLTTQQTNRQEGKDYNNTDVYFPKEITRDLEDELDQFMEDLFRADATRNPENSVTMYRMIRIYLQSLEVDSKYGKFIQNYVEVIIGAKMSPSEIKM